MGIFGSLFGSSGYKPEKRTMKGLESSILGNYGTAQYDSKGKLTGYKAKDFEKQQNWQFGGQGSASGANISDGNLTKQFGSYTPTDYTQAYKDLGDTAVRQAQQGSQMAINQAASAMGRRGMSGRGGTAGRAFGQAAADASKYSGDIRSQLGAQALDKNESAKQFGAQYADSQRQQQMNEIAMQAELDRQARGERFGYKQYGTQGLQNMYGNMLGAASKGSQGALGGLVSGTGSLLSGIGNLRK